MTTSKIYSALRWAALNISILVLYIGIHNYELPALAYLVMIVLWIMVLTTPLMYVAYRVINSKLLSNHPLDGRRFILVGGKKPSRELMKYRAQLDKAGNIFAIRADPIKKVATRSYWVILDIAYDMVFVLTMVYYGDDILAFGYLMHIFIIIDIRRISKNIISNPIYDPEKVYADIEDKILGYKSDVESATN